MPVPDAWVLPLLVVPDAEAVLEAVPAAGRAGRGLQEAAGGGPGGEEAAAEAVRVRRERNLSEITLTFSMSLWYGLTNQKWYIIKRERRPLVQADLNIEHIIALLQILRSSHAAIV